MLLLATQLLDWEAHGPPGSVQTRLHFFVSKVASCHVQPASEYTGDKADTVPELMNLQPKEKQSPSHEISSSFCPPFLLRAHVLFSSKFSARALQHPLTWALMGLCTPPPPPNAATCCQTPPPLPDLLTPRPSKLTSAPWRAPQQGRESGNQVEAAEWPFLVPKP